MIETPKPTPEERVAAMQAMRHDLHDQIERHKAELQKCVALAFWLGVAVGLLAWFCNTH